MFSPLFVFFSRKLNQASIVGHAVGTQIAEKPDAGLFFGEEESAKVAGELLDAGANRNEIVVRTLRSRILASTKASCRPM